MNYYQFNAEDLAADDAFKAWVCAPTPDTDTFWQAFLKDYPERYYQVQEARILVAGLQQIQQDPEQTQRAEKLWDKIETTINAPKKGWWYPLQTWKIAASVTLLLVVGWAATIYFEELNPVAENTHLATEWVEAVNDARQQMHLQLADGSQVWLEKNGKLRYQKDFSGTVREVQLTGEAFFEVAKNPKKPFIVYANGLVTKVLGTSFRIKAQADAATVTVDVKTGVVSVYAQKADASQKAAMVLLPNQKAVFQRENAALNKTLVEKPTIVLPKQEVQKFVYEDASAVAVFESLEKAYGVKVIYDEATFQNCTITISLDDEDLFQKLEVICKVLGAKYEIIETQIIISSNGC
ncbi:FecR family protein [Runella sp.]|uniref:FecR family protein n=1 Tax=Runella sp. TaxID=1960881 RepID=UPI0030170449